MHYRAQNRSQNSISFTAGKTAGGRESGRSSAKVESSGRTDLLYLIFGQAAERTRNEMLFRGAFAVMSAVEKLAQKSIQALTVPRPDTGSNGDLLNRRTVEVGRFKPYATGRVGACWVFYWCDKIQVLVGRGKNREVIQCRSGASGRRLSPRNGLWLGGKWRKHE
jgi:hypothetical protein